MGKVFGGPSADFDEFGDPVRRDRRRERYTPPIVIKKRPQGDIKSRKKR